MRAKVQDTSGESEDRARCGIVRAAMANALAADTVFLISKGEVHRRGGRDIGKRARGRGNSTGPLEKRDIAEAKRGTACVGIGRVCVLARAA
jgi:hypothetical protein